MRSTRIISRSIFGRRPLHATNARWKVTKFAMPAMSPTMTEGGIAEWKKKEGESFSAGDVLLEIETDKATIDVEAQDDGIIGKIIALDGTKNVPVGQTIALVAEEGDDISNLDVPEKVSSSPPQRAKEEAFKVPTAPSLPSSGSSRSTSQSAYDLKHSRPLFPSVKRLLIQNGVADATKIKGTGVRGMLTKGDVLAYLGKASGPFGTYKEKNQAPPAASKAEPLKPLDGPSLRKLIVGSLSLRNRPPSLSTGPCDFDSIISDYLPRLRTESESSKLPHVPSYGSTPKASYFDGLL